MKGRLTLVSGTYTNIEDFMHTMNNITSNVFGWQYITPHSDTSSNRGFYHKTEGEIPGRFTPYYGMIRGAASILYTSMYTHISDAGVTSDISYRNSPAPDTCNFSVSGNKDVIYVMIYKSNNTNNVLGSIGYLDTPYTFKQDPCPGFVSGQSSENALYGANATTNVLSYGVETIDAAISDGVGGGKFLSPSSAVSGTTTIYRTNTSSITKYAAPSVRDGKYLCVSAALYLKKTVTSKNHEIRGTLPNFYFSWGVAFDTGTIIRGSGLNVFSGNAVDEDRFVVIVGGHASNNTRFLGPIDEYDLSEQAIPQNMYGLKLYFTSESGRVREGAVFSGGRISRIYDQSEHPSSVSTGATSKNDASQAVIANMPYTLENQSNGRSVINFVSSLSTKLTGTVAINNDMTIFVVASYSTGTDRAPLLTIRGNISGQDTEFSINFNNGTNNSVSCINTGAGTIDKYEIPTLSSDTYYVITSSVSGNDTTFFLNGDDTNASAVTNLKGTVPSSATLNYSLGSNLVSGGGAGSVYADANIAEIIVYDRHLTDTERRDIRVSLGTKHNITVEQSI